MMGEKKRKICEIDPPPSPSPSLSPLQTQFHPNTPNQIVRYTPKHVPRRIEANTCYSCGKQGHWSNSCPLKLNNNNNNFSDHYPKILCDCGHGFCQVKTVSNNNKKGNAGKKYYACPIKRGRECGMFRYCDDKKERRPPRYKYPECECGAGVCRKVKDTMRPYFTCPVDENQGSCGYEVYEDELLDSIRNSVPVDQSSQRTHVFWEGYQNEETDYDFRFGGDLLVESSKRMRMMDNFENPSSMGVSYLKCFGISDFQVAEYLPELEFANSLTWEEYIQEIPFLLSQLSKPSRISCQRNLFQDHIFADSTTFGPRRMGWLGRLLFFYPTRSLKFPLRQPFLCCVFPSFNPIKLPKQVSICVGPSKRNQLSDYNHSQHAQISTGCDTEVSRDLNKSPANESKSMSKVEWQRQVVLFAQQKLLTDLETLNPNKHESMRGAAEAAFDVLDKLGIDHKQFSHHVLYFLDLASSMAEMDKSMKNFLTLDDYNKLLEDEKARFACIQVDCVNTETSFETSKKRVELLIEEISHYQAVLHEKQTQLKACELENLQIEAHLCDIRRSLKEAEATLKVKAEEAHMVKQLNEERQAKQIEAQTALQLAKLEMENV